jgi:glycine hydroxymethyltransferase
MPLSPVADYLSSTPSQKINSGALAYIANLETVAKVAPQISRAIVGELENQRSHLKLIASENYCSLATQLAMGNLLTDKYAEGFPQHRNYAGCEYVDAVESFAAEQACRLFGCEHAYVQPHSGADANMIAFWAILTQKVETPHLEKLGEPDSLKLTTEQWDMLRKELGNQRLLGLDLYSGGHLTHGFRKNVSAKMFDSYTYAVDKKTGMLDYDQIAEQAKKVKPLILLTGYSAYPRAINFRIMRQIADSVGAVFMVDMAHFAGLVAGGVFTNDFNPVPFAHIVTTTTHKTLRGPRGGMILSTKEFAESVDKGCPLVIGGPLAHVMAAKAVAFTEALEPSFREYAKNIVDNAKTMADTFMSEGMKITTDGTDNHLMVLDVTSFGINGRHAESAILESGITLNRNAIPFDPNGAWYTSGLRIGTPAVTTLGMGKAEMKEIVSIIKLILSNTKPQTIESGKNAGQPSKVKYTLEPKVLAEARKRTAALLDKFQVYPELDLALLKKHFAV